MNFAELIDVADGARWEDAPKGVRGYARCLAEARELVMRRQLPMGLTNGEFAVLQMLADGMNAPAIARAPKRSPHTVRAHTRAIISKFQTRGRAAAIANARRMGIVS